MESLLDIGVEEYHIGGGGVLRFHPGDPNLYARFLKAEEDFRQIETEFAESGKTGAEILLQMEQADQKMKALLNGVFGGENDFHKALGGVNLLCMGADGRTLASRLFEALEKILISGAKRFAKQQAEKLRGEKARGSQ